MGIALPDRLLEERHLNGIVPGRLIGRISLIIPKEHNGLNNSRNRARPKWMCRCVFT